MNKLTLARCILARRFTIHLTLLMAVMLGITLLATVVVSAADSDLDPTFDGDGIVVTDHAEFEQINDMVIQPDGKIVVVGQSGIFHGFLGMSLDMMVARYNIDGSLDSTFGNGGVATFSNALFTIAHAVALQPDGKIVVGGRGGSGDSNFMVVRYNTDGSRDATFGVDGVVVTPIGFVFSQIMDIAVQADGRIVAVGDAFLIPVQFTIVTTLVRYNPDGSLDFTFDGDGMSQAVPAGFATPPLLPVGLALQSDQKIVVAQSCLVELTQKVCTSRYNTDGSLDNSFDGDGVAETDFDSSFGGLAMAIGIQPGGKIVTAGHIFTNTGGFPGLARYNSDGSLDNSFDGDGRVIITNPVQFLIDLGALTFQPDGKILIAGKGFIPDPVFHSVMSVIRCNSDGSPDETFGASGLVTTQVGTVDSGAGAIAVHADSRIVAGGFGNFTMGVNEEPTFSDLALVRYGVAIDPSPASDRVNGGGWIDSPAGAFAQMPALTGKASFGFVSKHKNGATLPAGNTHFRFDGLNFQSTTHDSLVVSGNQAQCAGTGTINGSGSYQFMVTLIDGDQPGGDGQDRFGIRIWSDSGALIYDNQLTVLGGGNITIHR